MTYRKIAMEHDKKVALVAHDNKKQELVEWAKYNRNLLAHHTVYATGTTGKILEQELGFPIIKLQSGPLGGDQQIGAKIADGEIDFLRGPNSDWNSDWAVLRSNLPCIV